MRVCVRIKCTGINCNLCVPYSIKFSCNTGLLCKARCRDDDTGNSQLLSCYERPRSLRGALSSSTVAADNRLTSLLPESRCHCLCGRILGAFSRRFHSTGHIFRRKYFQVRVLLPEQLLDYGKCYMGFKTLIRCHANRLAIQRIKARGLGYHGINHVAGRSHHTVHRRGFFGCRRAHVPARSGTARFRTAA